MIKLIVGNIDISEYITAMNINRSPYTVDGSSDFENWDGEIAYAEKLWKTSIKVSAEGVPNGIAQQIENVVCANGFDVTYTSPAEKTAGFICTSYSAEADEGSHEDGSEPDWNIDLTLESSSDNQNSEDSL
jgi:hypothetical protein